MGLKIVKREGKSFKDRIYLPAILSGMMITLGHFLRNLRDTSNIKTMNYPEEQPQDITARYRGVHRLTKREDESVRCVACFMCATACPAECIFIEAEERNDGVDEKMPKVFTIDLLECVFCGACVEACPCDAIRMDTGIFTFVAQKREDFLLTKDKLLSFEAKKEDA
ncbi:MAG: NADH-quinone oxidoreductase subunit I [Sulfurospirillaceae bacterium]|jgi:NADH-quinone oxidoreductase subunit I|nr:NADH-quinone oxidoreductase subunit I [Sulfurospirillaceae bacterium]MDD2827503.1 NADH-quinone oxidoreductase subunit I [Sulfurospirillaceae bacterium]